ncbi:unnamed protein product [Staurois parvus]|uniref:Distal-less homeobox protein 4a n=1 Tax=Staurois parvus TaxID=386267 RepID=A0ABN9B0B6_9NEOB|nr:unnamed protein product [Staurois parvus]
MMDNQPPPHITGWIQSWEPTREMSPPLYSRDSTQEGHTIPHHHQVDEEQSLEPTREMSPSSVFPGFHTGRSHHPSPSSG